MKNIFTQTQGSCPVKKTCLQEETFSVLLRTFGALFHLSLLPSQGTEQVARTLTGTHHANPQLLHAFSQRVQCWVLSRHSVAVSLGSLPSCHSDKLLPIMSIMVIAREWSPSAEVLSQRVLPALPCARGAAGSIQFQLSGCGQQLNHCHASTYECIILKPPLCMQ